MVLAELDLHEAMLTYSSYCAAEESVLGSVLHETSGLYRLHFSGVESTGFREPQYVYVELWSICEESYCGIPVNKWRKDGNGRLAVE